MICNLHLIAEIIDSDSSKEDRMLQTLVASQSKETFYSWLLSHLGVYHHSCALCAGVNSSSAQNRSENRDDPQSWRGGTLKLQCSHWSRGNTHSRNKVVGLQFKQEVCILGWCFQIIIRIGITLKMSLTACVHIGTSHTESQWWRGEIAFLTNRRKWDSVFC